VGGELVQDVGSDWNGLAKLPPGFGKFVFREFRQGDDTSTYGPSLPNTNNSWELRGSMCASVNQPAAAGSGTVYDRAQVVGGRHAAIIRRGHAGSAGMAVKPARRMIAIALR
jgi:hypothetical protein